MQEAIKDWVKSKSKERKKRSKVKTVSKIGLLTVLRNAFKRRRPF
jgi:hypothetical protein